MALRRKSLIQLLLLLLTVYTITTDSTRHSEVEKRKHNVHFSKSKLKIDKGNPWPFLPSPGSHYTATKGFPSYPFMIVSPPGREKENKEQLQDEKGSKYFVSRRQSVPVPYQPQNIVGYVPVYYTPQYYNNYQPMYTSYYQPDALGNTVTQPDVLGNAVPPQYLTGNAVPQQYLTANAVPQQYITGGQSDYGFRDYPLLQSPFLFSKRSHPKKPRGKSQPMKRQFVPRHHWSFSQWPFDSHEYAFTKDPVYSSNHPHLPRWGPIGWGGAGPRRHWAINREGLPSPFGIGLAPHMGGQGYAGLAGHWPAGHGYPFPTHFPTPPHLQHLLP